MIAITKASIVLNNWRLNDCDIYITLFPCPMCASAIHQSRIKKIYYCEFNQNIKIKCGKPEFSSPLFPLHSYKELGVVSTSSNWFLNFS